VGQRMSPNTWAYAAVMSTRMVTVKLVRLVMVYMRRVDPAWRAWKITLGDVVLQTGVVRQPANVRDRSGLVVAAEISLRELPSRDESGRLLIPESERKGCEAAIEAVANILGVVNRCGRSIASPMPCVALVAEDDVERSWLDTCAGIEGNVQSFPRTCLTNCLMV
jgi:hypothetical protein